MDCCILFRIYSGRHPVQSAPHPVERSTPSLHSHAYSIPHSNVPHPQCLPSAELIHTGKNADSIGKTLACMDLIYMVVFVLTGSLLHPAGVCGSAPRHPSHYCGAAQQHPLHGPLSCSSPCTHSSQQWYGCYGDGCRDNHGHECRYK